MWICLYTNRAVGTAGACVFYIHSPQTYCVRNIDIHTSRALCGSSLRVGLAVLANVALYKER